MESLLLHGFLKFAVGSFVGGVFEINPFSRLVKMKNETHIGPTRFSLGDMFYKFLVTKLYTLLILK